MSPTSLCLRRWMHGAKSSYRQANHIRSIDSTSKIFIDEYIDFCSSLQNKSITSIGNLISRTANCNLHICASECVGERENPLYTSLSDAFKMHNNIGSTVFFARGFFSFVVSLIAKFSCALFFPHWFICMRITYALIHMCEYIWEQPRIVAYTWS